MHHLIVAAGVGHYLTGIIQWMESALPWRKVHTSFIYKYCTVCPSQRITNFLFIVCEWRCGW